MPSYPHRAAGTAVATCTIAPDDAAERLADHDVAVWHGNYYALEVMKRLGLEDSGGAVRVGIVHYNTTDEVDRLLGALAEL